MGAIGGLLAVVASVLAWKSSDRINKRMLALEEKREADKRLLRVRGQAESVFAAGVNLPERDGAGKWGIYLFNGSDQPIFDITVESRRLDNGSKNATCEIGLLPPGRYVMPADAKYRWGALVNLDRCKEEVEGCFASLFGSFESFQAQFIFIQSAETEVLISYYMAVLHVCDRSVVIPDVP